MRVFDFLVLSEGFARYAPGARRMPGEPTMQIVYLGLYGRRLISKIILAVAQ